MESKWFLWYVLNAGSLFSFSIADNFYNAKGQLISEAKFLNLIWPKNERNYFLIAALASKMGQIYKEIYHIIRE